MMRPTSESSEPLFPIPGAAMLIARSLRVARTAGARAEDGRAAARPRGKLAMRED